MKLNSELEDEVSKVYEKWLHSYLNGDVSTYDYYLDHSYRFIGSTNNEEFLSKTDTTLFFKATADQLTGKTQLKNETKIIEKFEELVFITHLFDAWFLINDEWAYYGRFRFTNALRQNKEGWRFIYQHFSLPDSKAQDGETLGAEQISKENQELRDAIKRKTKELQLKNRELEIETALEKVRSRSLAMHSTNELGEVVTVIVEKLTDLGVVLDANGVILCTYFPDSKDVLHWIVSPDYSFGRSYLLPYFEHPIFKEAWESKESGESYFSKAFSVEDKNSFFEYAFEHSDYKLFPDDFKKWVFQNDKHILSFAWQKNSAILIPSHTGVVPTNDDIVILKRFAKVFEQAYTRFLDLQKAEAQAREAQIEAALEKVRSRSLGMQKSNELKEVIQVVYDQFVHLNINVEHTGFIMDYKERDDMHIWLADQHEVPSEITIPYFDSPHWNSFIKAKEKGINFFANLLTFEEKNKFYKDLFKLVPDVPEETSEYYFNCPGLAGSTVLLENVGLYIENFSGIPYTDDENKTLMRFGKVFQQTYTRFLDLQKAEEQAREAQIEAALERVRSRSLAMHNSEDVGKCISTMFSELTALGVDEGTRFGIGILNHDNENIELWTATKDGEEVKMHIGNLDMSWHPLLKSARKAWKAQVPLHKYVLEGEDLVNYYEMINNAPDYKLQVAIEKLPEREFHYGFVFEHGFFYAFNPREFQPDLIHITKRFSSLFKQTYQRYLDLVNAEAQAREAQIEAALERVRSRSLAMHHSSELSAVVDTLLREFTNLEFTLTFCIINLIDEQNMSNTVWAANPETGKDPESYYMKFEDYPFHHAMWDAWKAQKKRFVYTLEGEEKKIYDEYLYSETEFRRFPKHVQEANKALERYVAGFTFFKYSGLQTVSGNHISEDELEILERFGRVFEQAYTRFLDLQKVEAQAREAQIEAALEKVRSRSLAMHKSDELNEVVSVLFEKFKDLQIPFTAVGIATNIEASKDLNAYVCGQNDAGLVITNYRLPYFDHQIPKDLLHAIEEQLDYFVGHYSKKEKDSFYEYVIEHTAEFRHLPEDIKRMIFDSTTYTISMVGVKNALFNINDFEGKVLAEHEIDIIKRFARVFDQAYTRFLDLQKAEVQTREAQIEVAVERVRAQSMAMHQPNDLDKVNKEILKQLHELNVTGLAGVAIWLIEDDGWVKFWDLSSPGNMGDPNSNVMQYDAKDFDLLGEPWRVLRESDDQYFVFEYPREKLQKAILEWDIVDPNVANDFREALKTNKLNHQWNPFARYSNGIISLDLVNPPTEDTKNILLKLAGAFDLAYQRFLDLQKAEAQAREAQIQLALERVRARTMAMQNSDELMETSELMFQQIKNLGIELWSCGFSLWYDDDSHFLGYNPGPDGKMGTPLKIPLSEDIFFTTIREAKRRGDDFLIFESKGESLAETYRYMDGLPVVGETMRGFVKAGYPLPTYQVTHCGFFSAGHLMFITQEPNAEAIDIFKRFTKVFDQTYTRFLDLEKAEAQTREAQINLAVERVRAKALAMHKSEEILGVVAKLKDEVMALDIPDVIAATIFLNEGEDKVRMWDLSSIEVKDNHTEVPFDITFKIKKTDPHLYMKRVWENQEDYFVVIQDEKGFERLMKWLRELNKSEVAEEVEEFIEKTQLKHLHHTVKKLNNGKLVIDLLNPPSDEMETILTKMGAAFDLAYKRFEDLQKAEAQTREAKIETALEKVRSRTMGMQRSGELADVANVLFGEMNGLVHNLWTCGFVLCERDRQEDEWWLSLEDGFSRGFFLPNVNDYAHATLYEGWLEGDKFRTVQLDGDKLQAHYDWLMEVPVAKNIFDEMEEAGMERPEWQKLHAAYFSKGYLVIITREPCPEEEIFKRFAAVFDQTYTRFLDLQKAEAQAREAQIEAALERVRSTSLAMHHSDELEKVVSVLSDRLADLGLAFDGTLIFLFDSDRRHITVWIATNHLPAPLKVNLPHEADIMHNPILRDLWNSIEKGESNFNRTYTGKVKDDYFRYVYRHNSETIPQAVLQLQIDLPAWSISYVAEKNSVLAMDSWSGRVFDNKDFNILNRFAIAFEQAYTRFLDLQKAEAQAREAQIEAALERVRSSAMAMHTSEGLLEIIHVLREQMAGLGEKELESIIIHIYNEKKEEFEAWYSYRHTSDPNGKIVHGNVFLHWTKTARAYKDREKYFSAETDYTIVADYKMLKEWYEYLEKVVPEVIEYDETGRILLPDALYYNYSKFSGGAMVLITNKEATDDSKHLLKRSAEVFNLAYTRFLDLQKAEAQAREAQIEAALERIRSRSMAMQSSDELSEVVRVMYDEVEKLEITSWGCALMIFDNKNKNIQLWFSEIVNNQHARPYDFDNQDHELIRKWWKFWKSEDEFMSIHLKDEEYDQWTNFMFENTGMKDLPKEVKEVIRSENEVYFEYAKMKQGLVSFINLEPFSEEIFPILKRIARTFEQAYTRFLDVKKAEAQAREAKIEAALEKVRSRTMGMQSSDELPEVANMLFLEVQALGIPAWSCGYCILTEDRRSSTCIMSSEGTIQKPFLLMHTGEASFLEWDDFVKSDQTFFTQELGGDAIDSHYNYMKSLPQLTPVFKDLEEEGLTLPTYQINHLCKFAHGFLLFITYEPVQDAHDSFKRFAKVFEQTYTRFLDLKKAEAQAREAQIEAALERVRSKAMAMRSSDDISEATIILFKEIEKLEIETMRCGILIIHNNKVMDVWTTYAGTKDEEIFTVSGQIDMTIHPLLENVYKSWENKERYTQYELIGKDAQEYYTAVSKEANYKLPPSKKVTEHHLSTCFFFDEGALFVFSKIEIPHETKLIFKRFARVFGLTYQRYKDLIESEKREKEAKKQSSLDRVRGEIASMRSTEDLNRITPIIWQELTNLGVPFFRCGLFIMNEDQTNIQVYLSDPNGKSLGLMTLNFETNELTKNSVRAWRENKIFTAHWNKDEFINWTNTLRELGKIENNKEYQGGESAPDTLHLHFVPFIQGMLYIGNLEPLTLDQLDLARNLAQSFAIAYSRYEDFNKLEKAKEQVESALKGLKETQTQLIHSEKMASLGELTAGIAHEIQNPLNFVNNFSEVSSELLDEIEEELANGDIEEVREILIDIRQNLLKINHHGKRADGIVKGMLQHSRSSSGEKESTDINKLTDEYLRLAYHGLRAKDKSFNANFETDFDNSIEKIMIVPQDIGRVVLNIINNSLFAIKERQTKMGDPTYKPTIWVSTKKEKDKIAIQIKDNGMGIPDNVKNKIFQPFFTTKPTGQGTGLGLSLSYDIVKAHGGELSVNSTSGTGSTLIITLKP